MESAGKTAVASRSVRDHAVMSSGTAPRLPISMNSSSRRAFASTRTRRTLPSASAEKRAGAGRGQGGRGSASRAAGRGGAAKRNAAKRTAAVALRTHTRDERLQIGRASCRERGENAGGVGTITEYQERHGGREGGRQ